MRVFALVTAVTVAAGCAHGVSWNAEARRLCTKTRCFTVGDPGPAWREVREHGEAGVGWVSHTSDAVILAHAACRNDAEATPLESLTKQLLIGYTDRHILGSERRMLDGREVRITTAEARLDGVPVVLELWVVRKDGCIYDLSYVAPPGQREAGEAAFHKVVDGFHATPKNLAKLEQP